MSTNHKLLLNTPETYYWTGFILADGSYDGRSIRIGLSINDINHLSLISKYLNLNTKLDNPHIHFSGSFLKDYVKKFDIRQNKTSNPPSINTFKKMNDALFVAFLIGFIDGDGNIQNVGGIRPDVGIRIKLHSSWLPVLSYFKERMDKILEIKTKTTPLINKSGYAFISFTDGRITKYLKQHSINLPVLKRKWNKIDENRVSKTDRARYYNEVAVTMARQGFRQVDIRKKLGISKAGISLIFKRNSLRGD